MDSMEALDRRLEGIEVQLQNMNERLADLALAATAMVGGSFLSVDNVDERLDVYRRLRDRVGGDGE